MVKTKNDQTLWLRWISDPYASCFSWKCPFRRLLWSLLFHVYLAVDGDSEAKNIHLPERLGQPKKSVATVCLFYIAKRWHGMWIWISSLQAVDWTCKFIICFNLWTTQCFSRSNVDTQLQRPFKNHGKKQRQSWGGKFMKIECLIVQFRHHCHHLASDMDVRLKIRYPLIHWLVITFCMNRVIYSPKSLYSIRNNCQWWLSRKSRWFPTFSHKHITFKSSTWFDMFHYKNCCKSGSQHSIQSVATMAFLPWRLLEKSTALILNILLITLVWY